MNRRSQIKNYVANKIGFKLPSLNVFITKRTALNTEMLPAAIVSIESEKSEIFSQSSQEVRKNAQLSIELVADANEESIDETLDSFTAQIEELFPVHESFNDVIDRCVLTHTETAIIREGEIALGMAKMIFDVTYNAVPRPTEDLTEFEGATLHLTARVQ